MPFITCPKCNKQAEHVISEGWNSCSCSKCKQNFQCLIARIRAKRSRGDKRRNRRDYSVRIKHNGHENLLEFASSRYHDFELRGGDLAAFVVKKGVVYIVHNFTVGQYEIVKRDGPTLMILLVLAMVIGLIAIVRHF